MIRAVAIGTAAGIMLFAALGAAFMLGCPLVDRDTIAPF